MTTPRQSSLPVEPVFLQRWSPRSFNVSAVIGEDDLLTMIEAARWAPSAYNIQPWRFTYSLRDDAQWSHYLDLLIPFNASWAKNASALIFLASDTLVDTEEMSEPRPSHYHNFDAGAAWAQLALQATMMGYNTHAMAGIHKEKAQEYLRLPDRYDVQIAIAVGQVDQPDKLPVTLKEREVISQRLNLDKIAFAGTYQNE